ncbi:hypothetical protein [Rubellimicrobium arenae]|uniref:hypothetical protein n=1 Tax=Rubellimicrobium arenae TaxID=2817372 RepID=UPI001B305030|nr:hypothetical protein [Rubellimicrobium arenae]
MDKVEVFEFRGQLPVGSFAEFARHRAGRLSLGLETLSQSESEARFRVSGPEDLVDAFEMALSLGPSDCLVLDVVRMGNGPSGSSDGPTRRE